MATSLTFTAAPFMSASFLPSSSQLTPIHIAKGNGTGARIYGIAIQTNSTTAPVMVLSYSSSLGLYRISTLSVTAASGFTAGTISEKAVRQKNTIDRILGLQAKYGFDSANFAVLNAEKNLVFEHIDDHTASMITYAINNAKKMTEFWTKGSEFEFMSYLNPEINSFTKRLQTLSNIFDLEITLQKGKVRVYNYLLTLEHK